MSKKEVIDLLDLIDPNIKPKVKAKKYNPNRAEAKIRLKAVLDPVAVVLHWDETHCRCGEIYEAPIYHTAFLKYELNGGGDPYRLVPVESHLCPTECPTEIVLTVQTISCCKACFGSKHKQLDIFREQKRLDAIAEERKKQNFLLEKELRDDEFRERIEDIGVSLGTGTVPRDVVAELVMKFNNIDTGVDEDE